MLPERANNDGERKTELRDEYVEAENAGDVDGTRETCMDDTVFIPPEAPPVSEQPGHPTKENQQTS